MVYNEIAKNLSAVGDCGPRPLQETERFIHKQVANQWPLIVLEEKGAPVAFGYLGRFGPEEGFRHSALISIHMIPTARRRQLGARIAQHLCEHPLSRLHQIYSIWANIHAPNAAALNLAAKGLVSIDLLCVRALTTSVRRRIQKRRIYKRDVLQVWRIYRLLSMAALHRRAAGARAHLRGG